MQSEYRFSWPDYDVLSGIIALSDTTYLAAGVRATFGNTLGNYGGIALALLNKEGDTLKVGGSGVYGTNPRLCKLNNDETWLSYQYAEFGSSEVLHLAKISADGEIVSDKIVTFGTFIGTPNIYKMIPGGARSLIIVGTGGDTSASRTAAMYIAR